MINQTQNGKIAGFTLIEISVVVLIMGLMALILLPRLTGLSGGNLNTVTRHLIGTIQTLKDEAESRQKIFRLNFNLPSQVYDISVLKENGEFVPYQTESLGKVQLPSQIRLKDMVTLRQGKVTDGTAYLFFYPLGRVEKAILHFEENGRLLTLKVMPLSGKVKLYDGYLEEQK
ncbi:MAG: prepilin-type N-terminal cleavage/methylation domain-containing protein [Nitrospirae bacterium]|nr:prepilin-type N-terminal cleavage/methylation domain-containing protein [Nitrospirota bacterium]MBI3351387.1 prepilin-type N-terminal cleavage/methylation domain-containing protein [Nitrospirota bacterium]